MVTLIVALTVFAAEPGPTLENPYRYPVTNPTELLEGNLMRKSPDDFRRLLGPRPASPVAGPENELGQRWLKWVLVYLEAFKRAIERPAFENVADRQTTNKVLAALAEMKKSGKLKGFSIDLTVSQGTVRFSGRVSSKEQQVLVVNTAQRIEGVKTVVDELKVAARGNSIP